MPTCAVSGCTSGYTSNKDKFHFFSIPKDPGAVEKWRSAIHRNDIFLKTGRAICEKHFRKEEISWKHQLLGPDGCVLGVSEYKVPRLREGSVPSLFPWTARDGSSQSEPWNVLADVTQNQNSKLDPISEFHPTTLPLTPSCKPATDVCADSNNSLPHAKRRKLCDQENEEINITGITLDTSMENTEVSTMTFDELSIAEISLPFG